MGKIKTKCHICSFKLKSEEAPEFCFTCGTSFTNPSEALVKKARAQWVTGKVLSGWDGYLYLTNMRLFYHKAAKLGTLVAGAAGGLVGALIAEAATSSERKEALAFSLWFNEIAAPEIRKRGLAGKDLFVNTMAGESFKIQTSKPIEWENAINEVRIK